jgi:serine/threonine protein kinase
LGKGGFGTVFLAQQIEVGDRLVALKVLNRTLTEESDLRRFKYEAASAGRIRHPNVVTIYAYGSADDDSPYIAMEFLEGESLRGSLKRRGALSVPEVAEILEQAAHGLNAAHKLGIIHRDLKPDNIFLTRGDEGKLVVKVVDFGLAKLREFASVSVTGTVLGTPAYMSYEQASLMRSDELDARSDVYSLGVVVYEMLCGRVPFHSDTLVGILLKHQMDDPPPFRVVASGLNVPPSVEAAVMKAMVKDRDKRFASALEFASAFAKAAEPAPPLEAPVPTPSSEVDAQFVATFSRRFRNVRRVRLTGLSIVFLAEQIDAGNRPVALEVLDPPWLREPQNLQRFQAEAASVARVRHPNVVTIYDHGQADDGTPYIAMESLEGKSLQATLRMRVRLPVEEVAEILQQAAQGVNAAHKLGILHRDLKPENIFLVVGDRDDLIIKIKVFGALKALDIDADGVIAGVPQFMSPEVVAGKRSHELDVRADVYSLGIIAYQMLTGRLPFLADSTMDIFKMHLENEPPPFRSVVPDLGVPLEVEGVVMKALAKDRDQRYASALEFARAFSAAASG